MQLLFHNDEKVLLSKLETGELALQHDVLLRDLNNTAPRGNFIHISQLQPGTSVHIFHLLSRCYREITIHYKTYQSSARRWDHLFYNAMNFIYFFILQ